jgi:hypothetical protein
MRMTITSTDHLVTLNGVPARVWEGETVTGVKVACYITRISPQTHDADALRAFEAELQECVPPSPEVAAIPLRLIL